MSRYRFDKDPNQQTIQVLSKMNQLDANQLSDLTDYILEFMSDSNGDLLINKLNEFAERYGIKIGGVKQLAQAFIMFFKGAFQNNLNSTQISEDLQQFGFDDEQIQLISGRWTLSLSSLNSSSLSQTLMVNQLLLPEWRFGVTASNKDIRGVGATFLQMKLSLDMGNDNTSEEYIELTLPQFYQFLASMEKAKAQLDYFS
eukprot:TRINITY_DN2848_c0_g1_i2.p1 TRINITY_DN2848_c0_g1~~TRINITY_DN2848_c0_g1_i2.p1  ORF type:complete len:200 (+),score=45.21 TRINITY_DN2848_c0_g1_i2:152-751(+)